MNNKGAGLFLSIIVAVFLFAGGMLILNHVKPNIDLFRSSDSFTCDSLTISDGAKVTCLGVDLIVPVLIVSIVSIAGGVITSRLTL